MKKFIDKIINIGIDENTKASDAKHIVLVNFLAIFCFFVIPLCYMPVYLIYYPETQYLVIIGTVYSVLNLFVLLFNYYKLHTFAKLFYCIITLIPFIFVPLLTGRDTNLHIFTFNIIFLAFFIFSHRERFYRNTVIVIQIALYIFLEIWFLKNDAIMSANIDFISTFKIINGVGLIIFFTATAAYAYTTYFRAETQLEAEREKSENLLLNILPESIAKRLKTNPGIIADRFEEASVLFADIENFTVLSKKISPQELVSMLDEIFSEFDALVEKHGLEKIKTIGDSYMVAGGIPDPKPNHLETIAEMALEMQQLINEKFNHLKLRIGIHGGPIVAGVIGQKKFIYDLWGDTVNTASRMESHGVAGEIQVTKSIYERLIQNYNLKERGEINVKGKGIMQTYFLEKRNV